MLIPSTKFGKAMLIRLIKIMSFMIAINAQASNVEAESLPIAEPFPDLIIGDLKTPVEVIEFSALTCSHCAHFQKHILPFLIGKYTNKKMAHFIHRDFVTDLQSLHGVTLARCSNSYDAFIKVLFNKQSEWLFRPDYQEVLANIAHLGGLDKKTYQDCLQDDKLKERIVATTIIGKEQYAINAVPTLIINGIVYKGRHTLADIGRAIEQSYNKATAKVK